VKSTAPPVGQGITLNVRKTMGYFTLDNPGIKNDKHFTKDINSMEQSLYS